MPVVPFFFFFFVSDEHLPMKFIEKLSKEWVSPIYVFFNPTPVIEYINDH